LKYTFVLKDDFCSKICSLLESTVCRRNEDPDKRSPDLNLILKREKSLLMEVASQFMDFLEIREELKMSTRQKRYINTWGKLWHVTACLELSFLGLNY